MTDRQKDGWNGFHPSIMLVAVLFVFISCTETARQPAADAFFSSEKYFSEEAGRLTAAAKQVRKVVRRNAETDSASVTMADWKKELAPFSLCNISQPSMRNSYRVDTVPEGAKRRTTYTALEPQLTVRSVEVVTGNGRIVEVRIFTADSNRLYSTSRTLEYWPASGYRIRGSQRMTFGEKSDYEVSAAW